MVSVSKDFHSNEQIYNRCNHRDSNYIHIIYMSQCRVTQRSHKHI